MESEDPIDWWLSGGLLTLLKSILGSLRMHFMSIFQGPTYVLLMYRVVWSPYEPNFLCCISWGNKMHWVWWDKLLTSRGEGGLNVGSLYSFNRDMLCKWM